VLLLVFSVANASSLYGIVQWFGANDTQVQNYLIEIDPTSGNWTNITDTFDSIFFSFDNLGISGYDQENQIFYYATNFDASFIYRADTQTGENLPPLATASTMVLSIVNDQINDQMLFNGIYGNDSLIVTIPTNPARGSEIFFNFTEVGISVYGVVSTVVDNVAGTFYVLYLPVVAVNVTASLGQFPLADPSPSKFTNITWPCGKYLPDFLAYDSTLQKFVGIHSEGYVYHYLEVTSDGLKCTITPLGEFLEGLETACTYDPTTTNLYFSYVTSFGTQLGIYNVVTYELSHLWIRNDLLEIEAAY